MSNNILNNVKNAKKIHFSIQKHVCYSCTLEKIYQHGFLKSSVHSSKPSRLIHLVSLSFSSCLVQSIDGRLHYLITIFSITILLFYTKNLKLQKQLSLIILTLILKCNLSALNDLCNLFCRYYKKVLD